MLRSTLAVVSLAEASDKPYLAGMRSRSPKHLSHGSKDKWNTDGVLLEESALGQLGQPIILKEVFGNCRPVEVEIGSGKGTFLLARAAARPELNFLGIEYARAYCYYAADRVRRHGLTNVRMIKVNAGEFFQHHLEDRSVLRVHIYFPDPWPKRRHQRRRLIQSAFIEQTRRVLIIGGQIIIVTDHPGYFEHIQRVFAHAPGFTEVRMPQMADADDEIVGTNFERKYIAQGRTFYSMTQLRYR